MRSPAVQVAPKVSVVIPVYNVESYLVQCLDSVIHQTLREIEIICMDDGSTDGCPAILDAYAARDPRIRVIHKANTGYGDTMNQGFSLATGQYIGIVESDDYILPQMYEVLHQKAQEHQVDWIKSDFYSRDGEQNCLTRLATNSTYYNRVIDLQQDLTPFHFPYFNTWTGIYKRSFIEQHQIHHNPAPGASYQDTGFYFQTYVWATRGYFCNQAFYIYRQDNPTSSRNNKGQLFAIQKEYAFIRRLLSSQPGLLQKYSGVYWLRKFGSYIWKYNRLDPQYKAAFLRMFHREFKAAQRHAELDYSLFDPKQLDQLKLLLIDYRQFGGATVFGQRSWLERLFAIRDQYTNGRLYKVLTLLGIKIKFRIHNALLEHIEAVEQGRAVPVPVSLANSATLAPPPPKPPRIKNSHARPTFGCAVACQVISAFNAEQLQAPYLSWGWRHA